MFISLIWLSFPLMIFKATAVEYGTHYCGVNTTSHIKNTTYYSNLKRVLDSLSSDTTIKDGIFLTKTAGNRHPDIAYGLYLCRGDIIPNDCRNCLLEARDDIIKTCPLSKEALSWKDNCMLRYANYSMISMELAPIEIACNKMNISSMTSEKNRLWEDARKLMDRLVTQVSTDSKVKFAFDELSYNEKDNIYGYVQCTPDLSGSDCAQCLKQSINRLPVNCFGKQGARVLTPSCIARFEMYKFLGFTAASSHAAKKKIRPSIFVVIMVVLGVLVVIAGICLMLVWKKPNVITLKKFINKNKNDDIEIATEKSLQFELASIIVATNNFSAHNKVGEGGFGGVYKGVLPNGRKIAVKRLSKGSGQGAIEFKNEVALLAKLQHRNLVRLLGFCLEAEEKILVYEYVPNKSLDYLLFDPTKQAQLDWSMRYKIICGTAKGMLYLHEDSRLRIIHRDVKASNILLDEDMNPRISDFGTARIFCGNQTHAKTNRIVGTYGYMSPEYAMHGNFSVKSDVFSLGVLFLEIISGKRNISRCGGADLLFLAWSNWKNGEPLKIADQNLVSGSKSANEVLQCINIALLCVQEDSELRPSMASVVFMLNNYSNALPLPQNPPFVLNSGGRPMTYHAQKFDNSKCKSTVLPIDIDNSLITQVLPR